MFWQLCEYISEIIIRTEIIQLCCFRNAIDQCTGVSTICCVMEHPVFLPKTKRPDSTLRSLSSYKDKLRNRQSVPSPLVARTLSSWKQTMVPEPVPFFTVLWKQPRQTASIPTSIWICYLQNFPNMRKIKTSHSLTTLCPGPPGFKRNAPANLKSLNFLRYSKNI